MTTPEEKAFLPVLEKGVIVIIDHSRKGTFIGKVIRDSGDWVTVEIVKGKAHYMSVSNNLMGRGNVGDKLTIRKSLCSFKPVEEQT